MLFVAIIIVCGFIIWISNIPSHKQQEHMKNYNDYYNKKIDVHEYVSRDFKIDDKYK